MQEFLTRFDLDSARFTPVAGMAAMFVWLMVLVCAISSVRQQPFTRRQRVLWILLMVCVPFVGVLCYLPFSFRLDAYPHLSIFRKGK